MISQQYHDQTFTLNHAAADAAYVACDCLGWFPMEATGTGCWRVSLTLPAGLYHVRYYVRRGEATQLHDQQDVPVGPPPAQPATGQPERSLTPAESGGDRDDAMRHGYEQPNAVGRPVMAHGEGI